MIPQIDLQGAGTAAAQVSAGRATGNDTDSDSGADPAAVHDFLKVLGTGAAGRHGPVTTGKPGTRPGTKTGTDVEVEPTGTGVVVAPALATIIPRAAPAGPPTEIISAATKTAPPTLAGAVEAARASGPKGNAVAAALPVATAQPAALNAEDRQGRTAGKDQVGGKDQAGASSAGPSPLIGIGPQGPSMPLVAAGFAAQQGIAAAKTAASPAKDVGDSDPDTGVAPLSAEQAVAMTGDAKPAVAMGPAPLPGSAEPGVEAPAGGTDAAQQFLARHQASPRSTFSQAAAILIWQAGVSSEISGGSTPTPSLVTKPAPPASPPIAATTSPDPAPPADPAPQAQLQMPQPVGDTAPLPAVADMPAGTAQSDMPPQNLDQAAPSATVAPSTAPLDTAPLDTALTKPLSGATTLPAPFHPLVASIRSHAGAHGRLSAGLGGAELVLHPADLGRIRFALTGAGDQLTITIDAENPDTLRLLQSHATDLRAELAREGLGRASLAFAGPGPGDSGGKGTRDQPSAAPPDAEQTDLASPTPLPPAALAPQPAGGLDLRL